MLQCSTQVWLEEVLGWYTGYLGNVSHSAVTRWSSHTALQHTGDRYWEQGRGLNIGPVVVVGHHLFPPLSMITFLWLCILSGCVITTSILNPFLCAADFFEYTQAVM